MNNLRLGFPALSPRGDGIALGRVAEAMPSPVLGNRPLGQDELKGGP